MNRFLMKPALIALAAFVTLVATPAAGADDPGWPREVPTSKGGTITVYEPQVESLRGDVVRFRAAVSYLGPDKKDPVFGVTWILGKLVTDRDARTVTTTGPLIERTRFPRDDARARDEIRKPGEPGAQDLVLHHVARPLHGCARRGREGTSRPWVSRPTPRRSSSGTRRRS